MACLSTHKKKLLSQIRDFNQKEERKKNYSSGLLSYNVDQIRLGTVTGHCLFEIEMIN